MVGTNSKKICIKKQYRITAMGLFIKYAGQLKVGGCSLHCGINCICYIKYNLTSSIADNGTLSIHIEYYLYSHSRSYNKGVTSWIINSIYGGILSDY